jgi:hypothetical protein
VSQRASSGKRQTPRRSERGPEKSVVFERAPEHPSLGHGREAYPTIDRSMVVGFPRSATVH